MITTKDWISAAIAAFLFYLFFYVLLYSSKYDVNLYIASFILLVLMYAACSFSPLFRDSDAWRRLFKR